MRTPMTNTSNQSLPNFLLPQTQQPIQITQSTPQSDSTDIISYSSKEEQQKAVAAFKDTYNNQIFEMVLDRIAEGASLNSILNNDIRGLKPSELIRWIHRDPRRKQRYYEAQSIGAEVVAAQMIGIADGESEPNGIPEDVTRSKLRIDTRRWLLGVWDKKRFGETKQVEINQNISITDALAQAQTRLIEGEIVDADYEESPYETTKLRGD